MKAERQRFPARADALPRVSAFVERRSRELGAGRRAALRLILLAEELFINTVMHGYGSRGGRRGQAVTLAVRDAGREIELVAEDAAPAFNPFGPLPRPEPGAVGGLGRVLVAGLSSRHRYERRAGRNRVTVAVLKQGAQSPRATRGRKK